MTARVRNPKPQARRILEEIVSPRLSLFDDSPARERQSALGGRIAEYAIISLVVLVIAGIEIARWMFRAPPQPALFGFMAGGVILYAVVRVVLILREMAVLRRESQSRAAMRAAIDEVCSRGWLLFDGLTDGRGHLLGSVLAGPAGLFTLVPRFIPRGGDLRETITVGADGMLMIGSHRIPADPPGQARRAAYALYEALAAAGMETVPVQPVVVFPGWKIETAGDPAEQEVWLLNENDLVPRLSPLPTRLEAKDLIGVSLLLEKFSGTGTHTAPVPARGGSRI